MNSISHLQTERLMAIAYAILITCITFSSTVEAFGPSRFEPAITTADAA